MTDRPRIGTETTTIAWVVAAMVPVVAVTASAVPWRWGFAFLCVAIAFNLQVLVRLKNPGVERFTHILVLSGSAPIAVRSSFGDDLTAVGVLNVVGVLVVTIGAGYLLADRVLGSGPLKSWFTIRLTSPGGAASPGLQPTADRLKPDDKPQRNSCS